MNTQTFTIPDEIQMLKLGAALAQSIANGAIIFLYGNLGAGKTTLARGMLRGLGYKDKVKSPTYTLVEPYTIAERQIYHFDFYRIHHPEEMEYLGINEYFNASSICIVEWPEHAKQWLPASDLSCYIEPNLNGRKIRMDANSTIGQQILKNLITLNEE